MAGSRVQNLLALFNCRALFLCTVSISFILFQGQGGSVVAAATDTGPSRNIEDSARHGNVVGGRRMLPEDGSAVSMNSSRVFGGMFTHASMHNIEIADGGVISLTLDRVGGAGFESKKAFSLGTFSVDARMPKGYSAGVCATFFLQSGTHDRRMEWDYEFLGSPNTSTGMTMQTNYFMDGTGEQEDLTAFGFDPAAAFHSYAIQWGTQKTVWLVDDKPIRTVTKENDKYPSDPMKVYFSIWDASTWATGTREKRIPVDYGFSPFKVVFKNFKYTPLSAA